MDDLLTVGVMTGTSMDGIDAALTIQPRPLPLPGPAAAERRPRLVAARHQPFEPDLRLALMATASGKPCSLDDLGELEVRLAHAYADSVRALLQEQAIDAARVAVIGAHGQTVCHRPGGRWPHTRQLLCANTLAVALGRPVVADFRRRDMALGGQGAPLAPIFHDVAFRQAQAEVAVLNLGGIANVTWLAPGRDALGFDTGPANVLMDGWIQRHRSLDFDRDGAWAASGCACPRLLERLMAEPYFALPPPKSTGREHFNLAWLDATLAAQAREATLPRAQDVQATLLELTVESVAAALEGFPQAGSSHPALHVCGGGAANGRLMQRLQERLPAWQVGSTEAVDLAPAWVEAAAFGYIAACTLLDQACSLPSVTGAARRALLGNVVWP